MSDLAAVVIIGVIVVALILVKWAIEGWGGR